MYAFSNQDIRWSRCIRITVAIRGRRLDIHFPNRCFWFSIQGQASQLPLAFQTGSLQSHVLTLATIAQIVFLILIYDKQIRGESRWMESPVLTTKPRGDHGSRFYTAHRCIQSGPSPPLPITEVRCGFESSADIIQKDNSRADDLSRDCSMKILQTASVWTFLVGYTTGSVIMTLIATLKGGLGNE